MFHTEYLYGSWDKIISFRWQYILLVHVYIFCMNLVFFLNWTSLIKIVKIFYIHGKFFKIQHVIYVIIWKNFVQIVLTYFISHVHWWYNTTSQLFSIWWITTDFAILWNINNRKLLFSCIWCPTLLGFFCMHFSFRNSWSISLKKRMSCHHLSSSRRT